MQKTRIFFPKDENLREKSTLFRIYNSLYVIEWDTNQNSENEKGTDLRYLQTVPNQYNIQVQQKTHTSFILIKWRLEIFIFTHHSERLFEVKNSEFYCEIKF
jgi:hypothetical protein